MAQTYKDLQDVIKIEYYSFAAAASSITELGKNEEDILADSFLEQRLISYNIGKTFELLHQDPQAGRSQTPSDYC